jgi:integrase
MFASEKTGGRSPVWLDVALQRHIRPAAKDAGITGKTTAWHTFRRSLSTLLVANGENVNVTQEVMCHSACSTTLELYARGDVEAKRAGQGDLSGCSISAQKLAVLQNLSVPLQCR